MKIKVKWKQANSETVTNVSSAVASNNTMQVSQHNKQTLIPLENVDFITIIYEVGDKQYKEDQDG